MAIQEDWYPGGYNPEERFAGVNSRWSDVSTAARNARREKHGVPVGNNSIKKEVSEPKKPPRDPLMEELNEMLTQIQALKKEAEDYSPKHINQDFRRINASLLQFQLKLDRIKVNNRDDLRQKKREGIRLCENGANTLMEHIHDEDYRDCQDCLKL